MTDQDRIDSSATAFGKVWAVMRAFGRWLVRRRTPLVVIPMIAGLIVAGSIGAQMMLERVPEQVTAAPPVICWDKSEAPAAADCSLPTGEDGLQWVFPSFDPQKSDCRNLLEGTENPLRPASWACDTASRYGASTRVTYIELAEAKAGRIYFQKQFKGANRAGVKDKTGKVFRFEWRQRTEDGFEVASVYKNFPFAVTVTSDKVAFLNKIYRSRVKFRQPERIAVRKDPQAETAGSSD